MGHGKRLVFQAFRLSTPTGTRTPVPWLRTKYPRPLDDGGGGDSIILHGPARRSRRFSFPHSQSVRGSPARFPIGPENLDGPGGPAPSVEENIPGFRGGAGLGPDGFSDRRGVATGPSPVRRGDRGGPPRWSDPGAVPHRAGSYRLRGPGRAAWA